MSYSVEELQGAHLHSSNHRDEVMASTMCGCFHCESTFSPSDIDGWIADRTGPKGCPVCPRCGIDSVLGDASGFPVTDPAFLLAMYDHWFGHAVSIEKVFRENG